MKLWRKLANKVTIDTNTGPLTLTGRELKRYHQTLTSAQKPASKLLLSLINRM